MVIGSHNAWSYAKPKKLWAKLIAFTAKCQKYDIKTQYEKYQSRCFDLRIRFDKDTFPQIVHGPIAYRITVDDLFNDLSYLNNKGDCSIRLILDIRKLKDNTDFQRDLFIRFCKDVEYKFLHIIFFCGENLLTKEVLYNFNNYVSCEELYSSVTPPKIIDDWIPWLYARLHNKENIQKGTDRDVLLIDFVNIQ